ncbi:MAG: hypothetical protein HOW73_17855 [Polyangiaceae bacterium]|nr:hypothetical protein [Polyangiaceae bacterium]
MHRSRLRWALRGAVVAAGAVMSFVTARSAEASNGLDVPDSGALQVGRGGAWVARADDPLAVYMNPAAMSFQASGVHLGAHLMIQSSCFARVDENGQPVSPGNNIPGPGAPNGPEAETCVDSIFPNPQLAGVFRITDALAIGASVMGPHAVGNIDWPESVPFTLAGNERTQPAPTRYMMVSQQSLLVFPTISVSYAVIPDELSLGAGFVWGIAHANFTTFTESTSSTREDDFTRDVKADLTADDFFVPGFVVGANWRASKNFDIGAWFHWSDKVSSTTKLRLESNYWLAGGTKNENPCTPADPECNVTIDEEAGTLELTVPMEAKLGVRYHHPLNRETARPGWSKREGYVRDPLTEDLFDVEVDLTYANNAAVDAVEIRFHEGIQVKGTPGTVPVNGDIIHDWKDVLGVRWGSDVTVLPNLLGVRAGGFFESKGQRDQLANLDFHMGWKAGISAGGTVRVGPVDMHLAYQHVFYGTLDNGGDGELRALSGDATTGFRSQQSVNGGRFSQQLNEVAAGATLRF